MRIIAKKGSALEQTIKQMHGRIKDGFDAALDLTEQMAGARPISPAVIFHWGTIAKFVAEFTFRPEDEDKIEQKVLRPMPKVKNGWKPNLRTKAGNEFRAAFCKLADEWAVTDEPLHEFGINMIDKKRGVSHFIRPIYDSETGQYYLLCDDRIPQSFDKAKLAKDQFEIDYEG